MKENRLNMSTSKLSYYMSGLTLISIVFLLISGCTRDTEYKSINFSNRIDIAQPEKDAEANKPLRVAVGAMISPKETTIYYRELLDYLGSKLGHDIELIQRKTYGEINELLAKGHIDLAFICTGPYAVGKEKFGFEAIATPIVRGEPFYQSYLIVHKESVTEKLEDLKGKIFAFTDPESNTGSLVPHFWIDQMGLTPDNFFKSVTYTYSHDNSIMAVAKKLVDGAAVDGHMWEYYQQRSPFYTSKTRVIKKSEPFGSPPLVVSSYLKKTLKSNIAEIVLSMHQQPAGVKILKELMIDQFVEPQDDWYKPVRHMMSRLKPKILSNDAS
jgi:phosphonate transport system substrate-binding protein